MAWTVAPALEQMQRELNIKFPNRIRPDWTIGDEDHSSRTSDHNPNWEDVVTAMDVRGRDVAQWLWDFLLESRDKRLKYVIHDEEIFSSVISPWIVGVYYGSNGHIDHLHVSVGPEKSKYDDNRPWGINDESTLTPPRLRRIIMNVGMPLLKKGHEGGDVTSLQVLLNEKAGQGLKVDGDFGKKTKAAVINVQNFFNLNLIDGEVGEETWPTMFL